MSLKVLREMSISCTISCISFIVVISVHCLYNSLTAETGVESEDDDPSAPSSTPATQSQQGRSADSGLVSSQGSPPEAALPQVEGLLDLRREDFMDLIFNGVQVSYPPMGGQVSYCRLLPTNLCTAPPD